MVFIHKGKKLNVKYEYGFYGGCLFTVIVMLAAFLVDLLRGKNPRYLFFFTAILLVVSFVQFRRAKTKSGGVESIFLGSKE